METNRSQMRKFRSGNLFLLALFLAPFLYAQNTEGSGNTIVRTGDGYIVSQIISFPAVPNVSRYEVEIEKQSGTGYNTVELMETGINIIELTLRAGFYRYRVTAFNKMNLPESRSRWQEFKILPATRPWPESYQPFYGLYYELADPSGSIVVYGEEFTPQSEFALIQYEQNTDWTGVKLENHRGVIMPDQVEVNGNQARLSFNRRTLRRGYYHIFARNPGGMWTIFGQVRVGFRSDTDFTFSFGYSPMIAAFDINNALDLDVNGNLSRSLDRFNPRGYYFRLGWLPVLTRLGNFGLEAQFEFLIDNVSQSYGEDYISIFDYLDYGTVNLLYQLPAGTRWQHNIRVGAGLGKLYHWFENDDLFAALYFNLGYSAQYFIWKNLFFEAGLDIQYAVSPDNGYTLDHLLFRPALGLGWQMGKWAEYAEVAERGKRGEDFSVPVRDTPRAEIILSFGWSPMIPLAGIDLYARYEYWNFSGSGSPVSHYEKGERLLRVFNPLGASYRIAYIPYKWGKNKLGFEFEHAMLDHINRDRLEKNSGTLDLLFSELLFLVLYQRALDGSWQMNVRAGAGFASAFDYYGYYEYHGDTSARGELSANIASAIDFGASAQYFFRRNAYVEAGLDLVLIPSNQTRLVLRPSINIGWQFKRDNETGLRLPGTGLP